MRKLYVYNMVSLDGYFCGPNGEIDWHVVDKGFDAHARGMLSGADTILFGRLTYELMAAYWPTPEGLRDDPLTARYMNETTKVVFSTTLDTVAWENTTLLRGDLGGEVMRLKAAPGRDMVILGSGSLVVEGTRLGLIDEYVSIVAPIILGAGRTPYAGLGTRLPLRLTGTRALPAGHVVMIHEPVRAAASGDAGVR